MVLRRFAVLTNIEMGDKQWRVQPPLECEITYDGKRYGIDCDLISITGCEDADCAILLFEGLLRKCIVSGKIRLTPMDCEQNPKAPGAAGNGDVR